jgi:hypothetical protein
MVPIFQQVIATQDRYGLQAYLTAVENASLREKLEKELQPGTAGSNEEQDRLRSLLRTGVLLAEEPLMAERGPVNSAMLS